MEPASAIVALVDDDTAAIAVLVAEQITIHLTETVAVHRLDVHVGHLPARETVDELAVTVYPTLVDKVAECRLADGFYHYFKGLSV